MGKKKEVEESEVSLKELAAIITEIYGFNVFFVKKRDRKRVYAKKVFAKIAREIGYSCESIGDSIGMDHSSIVYHQKTFNLVFDCDIKAYNKAKRMVHLLKNEKKTNSLKDKSVELMERINIEKENFSLKQEIESLSSQLSFQKKINNPVVIEKINNVIKYWTSDDIELFIETKLNPFNSFIEARDKRIIESSLN